MNYNQYYPIDVVNGPGTRCVLFVSGCVHQCRGCYNKSTWSLTSGLPFTPAMEDQIIQDLQDTRIPRRGLTLSGGDPLHPANLSAVRKLCQRVREECPGKDIWMWTGYVLAELTSGQKQVTQYIDVLIDGKFEQDLADPALEWRGSSNQVIHYLRKPE
ncbi:anaerobic ribonucleotide reductase-activating protein [Vibrio sp. HA2012]|uniref:anaerobic ribonucleoside-triphosphate reductase-activating protein n=1 Tax=Vibrio sp. HA2012 TaxID=1971595 RepID=UPI000C2C8645|nr:anaerobic ribonucleoside-triphosphate reductase-activating protein [Vibrio sp. HA2012]PJC87431.1 anaerobic ribonucleotide reductase-activating protein [Vibrio sp. HA2012]